MLIGIKDVIKTVGVTIVTFCAVFVCTFFLNFYLDAKSLGGLAMDEQSRFLYDAQMATAKLTCAISGGFLAVIAVIAMIFYIKQFIDGNAARWGTFKAMGYSDWKIALGFSMFGASVLSGAVLGYGGGFIIMPTVYDNMSIQGLPEIEIEFHPVLPVLLVLAPTVIFSLIAVLYAKYALRKPIFEMLRGKTERSSKKKTVNGLLNKKKFKESENGVSEPRKPFLAEMRVATLSEKKSLAFFVAFAAFCFSSMIQMSASMKDLSSVTMGAIIFGIGVVLAVATFFMALVTLISSNAKNIAVMKAFGYTLKECASAVLGGYVPFAVFGFAIGTGYQYGLLYLMVNLVFKDVGAMPEYKFGVPAFFITLAAFVLFCAVSVFYFVRKIGAISLRKTMTETF